MEDGRCVLARMLFEVSIGSPRERADGAGDVIVPGWRSSKAFDRLDALHHCCDVELGIEHIGVDERSVKGIGRLNGHGSACS